MGLAAVILGIGVMTVGCAPALNASKPPDLSGASQREKLVWSVARRAGDPRWRSAVRNH